MNSENLAQTLQTAISTCPHSRVYRLAVVELSEAIVLKGVVASYYQKQMAQHTAMDVLAKKGFRVELKNDIVVQEKS